MSNSQTIGTFANPQNIRPAIVTRSHHLNSGKLRFEANSYENGEAHEVPISADYDPGLTLAGNHASVAISLMKDREWYADYDLVMGDGRDGTFVFVQIPVER